MNDWSHITLYFPAVGGGLYNHAIRMKNVPRVGEFVKEPKTNEYREVTSVYYDNSEDVSIYTK